MGEGDTVTLLICDDHKILTDALATVVGLDDTLEMVADPVHDAERAIEVCSEQLPDVVLMDMALSRASGSTPLRMPWRMVYSIWSIPPPQIQSSSANVGKKP